jgi:hypothetical protein
MKPTKPLNQAGDRSHVGSIAVGGVGGVGHEDHIKGDGNGNGNSPGGKEDHPNSNTEEDEGTNVSLHKKSFMEHMEKWLGIHPADEIRISPIEELVWEYSCS